METILVVYNIPNLEYFLVIPDNIHRNLKRANVYNRDIWVLEPENPSDLLILPFHKLFH